MLLERVYLDTNILIRAFEGAPNDMIAQDLIGMLGLVPLKRPEPPFVTSHITLAEALVVPIREADLQMEMRYKRLLSASSNWMQVRQISQSVLVLAAGLRANGKLKLPDAIHMATAIVTGCSHFLTNDTDFSNDTAIWPDAPEIIRPDDDTLSSIIAWVRK